MAPMVLKICCINKLALPPSSCRVRMWIIDLERVDEAEVNNTALFPSTVRGQWYWDVVIPREKRYVNLRILSRFVKTSLHTFYWSEPQDRSEEQEVPLCLPPGSPLQLVWSTGQSYRCLVLSDMGTFQTNDAFHTYEEVKNEHLENWTVSPFLTNYRLDDITRGPYLMLFLDSALTSLLLWSDQRIMYSFQNNEWGELRPASSSDQICSYTVGVTEPVCLHAWLEPEAHMVLYLNQQDQFNMVTLTAEGRLHIQRYPLQMETRSAMSRTHHDCPFTSFEHSMGQMVTKKSHFEAVDGVTTINTIGGVSTASHNTLMEGNSSVLQQTSGVLNYLELLPSQIGNTCKLPRHRISQVQVGCPPNKHIRVARYDGDMFVKRVEANFIVWEQFGWRDYFNETMRQVYVLLEVQSWRSMLMGGKSLEEAWGPENCRSCFKVTRDERGDLDQPYEIMNRSSTDRLTFSQNNSAIYVFNIKVPDPDHRAVTVRCVWRRGFFGAAGLEPQSGPEGLRLPVVCVKRNSRSFGPVRGYNCFRDEEADIHNVLVAHMTCHREVKLHCCHVCGRECGRKGDLKIRMRIHRGEKPYSCSLCGKGLTHSGHLKKRMRSHTGERLYRCQVCDKGFTQTSRLMRHMTSHSEAHSLQLNVSPVNEFVDITPNFSLYDKNLCYAS
ncbi:LOW QUALITY PROTEIN: cation channel sperm-associated auxiliary subunit epsilon-like [Centroberyx gerrardi]